MWMDSTGPPAGQGRFAWVQEVWQSTFPPARPERARDPFPHHHLLRHLRAADGEAQFVPAPQRPRGSASPPPTPTACARRECPPRSPPARSASRRRETRRTAKLHRHDRALPHLQRAVPVAQIGLHQQGRHGEEHAAPAAPARSPGTSRCRAAPRPGRAAPRGISSRYSHTSSRCARIWPSPRGCGAGWRCSGRRAGPPRR